MAKKKKEKKQFVGGFISCQSNSLMNLHCLVYKINKSKFISNCIDQFFEDNCLPPEYYDLFIDKVISYYQQDWDGKKFNKVIIFSDFIFGMKKQLRKLKTNNTLIEQIVKGIEQ